MYELESALADACAGNGRIALLAGTPGIGKTRISNELVQRARSRNARVIAGRCYEGEGAPAYWPWIQVVRSCIAECETSTLQGQLGNGAADLAQLVPEIRDRLPGLPAAATLPPAQERFRLFDSVTTYLKKVAAAQPLVLVLDDLHRADLPSLLLLHFLAQQIGEAKLFVLCSYRDVGVGAEHPLTALLAEVGHEAHCARISLRALPDEDVCALVAIQAGADVPDGILTTIVEKSKGNPLFVKEMWRHLIQEGLVYRERDGWRSRLTSEDGLRIPEGVRQVIGRRLARCSEGAKQVLTLASVLGSEFHCDVLQRFAQLDDEQLFAALDEAQGAQLIEDFRGPSGLAYRFSHSLIQETLYDSLSAVRRQRLHLRAGETLEELRAGRLELHWNELARHFTEGNDAAKAIEYARRAGEAAQRLYAWEPAIRHWKAALELLEAHGGALHERTELVDRLDDLTYSSGFSFEVGTKILEKELAIQETLGDRAKVAAVLARLGLRAVALGGTKYFDLRNGLAYLERARMILQQESPNSLELVHVYQNLDQACIYATRRELGEGYARNALALLQRIDAGSRAAPFTSEHHIAVGLSNLYLAIFRGMAGELGEAFDLLEQFWSVCDASDHALGASFSRLWIAIFHLWYRRDPRAARSSLELELARPRQRVDSYPRAAMLLLLGQIHIQAGELQQARALRCAANTFSEQLGERIERFFSDLLAAEGEWEVLEERAQRGLEDSRRTGDDWSRWRFAHDLGALCLRRGQRKRAEELLRTCLEIDEREQMPAHFGMSARVLMTQLLAKKGRVPEAQHQLKVCLEVLGRGEDWGAAVGRVALAQGSVLVAEGRFLEAKQALKQASSVAREYGLPWDEADALEERARLYRARDERGDRAQAARWLDAAVAIYDRLGASRHRDLVLAEKQQLEGTDPLQGAHLEDADLLPSALGGAELLPSAPVEGAELLRSAPPLGGSISTNLLCQEGEYWTITYEGMLVRLRDSLGIRYIAELIREPGRGIHVADLAQIGRGGAGVRESSLSAHGAPVLDARARSEYRERLDELRAEVETASDAGDLARAERTREELELVSDALAAAYGLGNRVRASPDPVERLRKAVSNRIKKSVAKISSHNAALGLHLANSMRTGVVCSYTPERSTPWIVEAR